MALETEAHPTTQEEEVILVAEKKATLGAPQEEVVVVKIPDAEYAVTPVEQSVCT